MADNKRNIEIVFNAVDKTGQATQSALDNVDKFSNNLGSVTAPVANFTASAVKLEASLLAAGAAITAFAIKAAGDFEGSFGEISTLIDEPVGALGDFRESLLEFSGGSVSSFDDVSTAIYSAISASVDYKDSIDFVKNAEKLAVAGRANLGDTTLALASTLNAYGASTDEAQRFSDALFFTVKQGLTTLPELASSLSNVTGNASSLNIPIETLGATLAQLTSTGLTTGKATTSLNQALANILKPSKEAAEAAAAMGIEFNAAAIESKGFEGVIADVQRATGGSAEEIGKLFGSVEAAGAILKLTGTNFEKFEAQLKAFQNTAGATEAAYEKMAVQFEFSNQRVANAFREFGTRTGQPLLDEYSDLASAVAGVFQALSGSVADDQGLGRIVEYVEANLDQLAQAVERVATNLPQALQDADLSGFTGGLEAIGDALSGLFDGQDFTSVEGLTSGIELLGAAFEGLGEFTGGVIDSLKPLFDLIVDLKEGVEGSNIAFREAGEIAGFVSQLNFLVNAASAAIPVLSSLSAVFLAQKVGLVPGAIQAASAISGLIPSLTQLAGVGGAFAGGWVVGNVINDLTEAATGNSLSTWLVDAAAAVTGLDDAFADLNGTTNLDAVATSVEKVIEPTDELNQKIVEGVDFWGEYGSKSGEVVPVLNDLGPAGEKAADGLGKTADAIEKIDEISPDNKAKIAIAAIEAQATTSAAKIEADATRIAAAFESIGVSVQSTGDVLGDLFDALGDDNISKFDKLGIKEQIEVEQERREESLRLQQQLLKAEIRQANARADALERGDGLIRINGEGLQPHLEAFMFEILEQIQVKVNADGYDFLLGGA